MILKRKAEEELNGSRKPTLAYNGSKQRKVGRNAGEKLIERANALSARDFHSAYISDDVLIHSARPLSTENGEFHKHNPIEITFHHIHQLNLSQLITCLDLIDFTSRKDYENSAWGWHPRRKRREMQDDDMRYLLVRDRQDRIQGFLSFMLTHDSTPAVPVLYIYEIHLRGPLQKQGLGTHLMNVAEAIARGVGVDKVMLTCFLSNLRARQFYQRKGYVADGCSPGPRRIRSKVVEPDYVIMSKAIER